nr:hypothetical protein X990_3034 [Burkholderia pseudomallei MSHR4868]
MLVRRAREEFALRQLMARSCGDGAHVVRELEPANVCTLIDAVNDHEGNPKHPTNTKI